MKQDVNKIQNADFSRGRTVPSRWSWSAGPTGSSLARDQRWQRDHPRGTTDEDRERDHRTSGIIIVTQGRDPSAHWHQTVVCKPQQFYRIEATVTCDLSVPEDSAKEAKVLRTSEASTKRRLPSGPADCSAVEAGFVLSVQPINDDRPAGDACVTPAILRASKPVAVRTYYQVPKGIRRLRISVGVDHAVGRVSIRHVRCIPILPPDQESHPMAIPPPPHTLPAPRVARSVCIVSSTAAQRPLTQRLAAYFGASHVKTAPLSAATPIPTACDALILPDSQPPARLRSVAGLIKLARERIVIVSLPAFRHLTGDALSLRRIEQDDDPIHAKVVYANHATRGFALHDIFPYAWAGRTVGSFVQNQYRRTPALKTFCEKHGFVTLLTSMCDRDVTSDRPICLYKETSGGGLFVLDIEPAEAGGSTFGDETIALHLLLSILGQPLVGLGQYVSPVPTRTDLHRLIRDLADRFEPFVVHDADRPVEEVTEQMVTIGREDRRYGLSLPPKPTILVRSGLTPADAAGVYAALLWFKQLIRMAPHTCPYAQALASQFRLAWIPSVAPWHWRDGWRADHTNESDPSGDRTALSNMTTYLDAELQSCLAAPAVVIDIVSRPCRTFHAATHHRAASRESRGPCYRVVVPDTEDRYPRYARWLPRLAEAFPPGRYFAHTPSGDTGFADRDSFDWRRPVSDVEVIVEPATTSQQRAAIEGDPPIPSGSRAVGGKPPHGREAALQRQAVSRSTPPVVRIELPEGDADFAAHSIYRTDIAATLLEHVIGLEFGLIAVNRQDRPVKLDAFPPVPTGEALILDSRDPALRVDASQVG